MNTTDRIKANQRLLEILKETLCKNPGEVNPPIDRFYEEPAETLKRIGYSE